ncbi:MAG: sugar ABC transporter ATP-binding protein [Eubacteriales bacterium]
MDKEYLLEMKGITKSYYGNTVLKNVDLSIKPGEIHCLMGENGAGKSTLMNVLFGMNVIHSTGGFEGEIFFDGEKRDIESSFDAMNLGIGMVHQEFMLIPDYSISENIKLNRELTKDNFVSRLFGPRLKTVEYAKMGRDARKALDKVEMNIDEWIRVAGLPVGYMQFIEIAREIDKTGIKFLVFDEPTAVLTESEASNLLRIMRKLADSGIAILFITHRLDEVIEISDNITVLRDGELVAKKKTSETTSREIAELMVGRKIELTGKEKKDVDRTKDPILELKDFKVKMPGEEVKGIVLKLYEGEILGIGGLAGLGKLGISNGIMGLYPTSGEIILRGEKITNPITKEMLEKKIAFVSEDRKEVGLVTDATIELNTVFTAMNINNDYLKDYKLFTLRDKKRIQERAEKMIKDLDIRCTSSKQMVGSLSGGNQQKVCIARALTQDPEIILVSEPTRGIDIGAKKIVLDILKKLNKDYNMTIIMTSSELNELRGISDRIAIVTEGKIAGILKPEDSDANFGLLMAGKSIEEDNDRGDQDGNVH